MDIKNLPERNPLPGYFRICNDDGLFRILDAAGRRHRMRPEAGNPTLYVAGVAQVETLTITAAAGATGNGNLVVTVTAAGIVGSPLAVNVPVTTAMNTASLVAAQIRSVLGAITAITDMFTVGGATVAVVLTRKAPVAPDATMSVAVAVGLGVSAASSVTSPDGVARVYATPASKGDQMIGNGNLYTATADVTETSTTGWSFVGISVLEG
jgi:hypothetical protein